MSEGVLVLEPGDERAKKIGKAMANESATAILSTLKEGDLTLSEISERMNQPMTTVKYHVENLLDAELIEVRKIKYSEKGREVKVYGVNDRLVIVAPSGGDIKDTLLKYASVFAILLIATLAMVAVSPTFNFFPQESGTMSSNDVMMTYASGVSPAEVSGTQTVYSEGDNRTLATSAETYAAKGLEENVSATGISGGEEFDNAIPESTTNAVDVETEDPGAVVHLFIIAFFLGGCLILAIMMLYEVVVWRKEKKFWSGVKDQEEEIQ
ncbi:ArsR/SmtB family transcription factor [Methanolacinia petrolearia]|uniref:ArsR/SmtB family transcription factor n=1 Tax=Methanolacinia petrolearia TaxID=54120 RepID=UPI003BAB1503